MRGKQGGQRIGNNRSVCATCNNFAQNIRRLASKRLKEKHPAEYEELRVRAELDLYPQVIEEFRAVYPPLSNDIDEV